MEVGGRGLCQGPRSHREQWQRGEDWGRGAWGQAQGQQLGGSATAPRAATHSLQQAAEHSTPWSSPNPSSTGPPGVHPLPASALPTGPW